ncbi:MAG: hypothetical protein A2X49_07180 [Lentisphaerae bacterium GWF2_52_8]|nr:MAG: hypothetical protein A2X49_07180 [Lentisphaerae bacterium GWF2_52_8]
MNFWDMHGFFFLAGLFFFPRLTLLLSSVASGGVLWWLGWVFTPRLLVAFLATMEYAFTNPFLVLGAWIWACIGEVFEKRLAALAARRLNCE